MFTKIAFPAGLCLIFCACLYAQPLSVIHDQNIETIASSAEVLSDTDLQSIIEDLEKLRSDPVNINTASEDELKALPFLNEFEIREVVLYRQKFGPFLTVYEMQLVHGLDVETAQMLLPYISVDMPLQNSLPLFSGNAAFELLAGSYRVFQKSRGYLIDTVLKASPYEGGPWRVSSRLLLEKGRLAAGITVEKDPGEILFSSNRKGFDFCSANIRLVEAGPVNIIIAGDYRLQFGQGLTLWNGYSPGKSSMPVNIIKRPGLLKPYTSNDEDNFFRGVAVNGGKGNLKVTLFWSYKPRDASVYDTLSNGTPVFATFVKTGYHRTAGELAKRNTIVERAAGAGLTWNGSFFRLGAVLSHYKFSGYMNDRDALFEVNDFMGNSLLNAGFDYSVYWGKLRAAGEISYGNRAVASLNSIVLNTGRFASLALLYRHYPAKFFSLYPSAFSEGSDDRNESGFYIGTTLHPVRHLTVSGYADFFSFPWMKHNTSGPSAGYEYLLLLDFDATDKILVSSRLKFANREAEALNPDEDEIQVYHKLYRGFRADLSYGVSESFLMKSRAEYIIAGAARDLSHGLMLYQDVKYSMSEAGITWRAGYAYFATDDFNSRIYIYEPQTVSSFSSTQLYGRGHRMYLMAKYDVTKRLSFWIRFSGTWHSDRNTTGSGYSLINSAKKHDIRFQVRARF